MREEEAKKKKDEVFNEIKPMVAQDKQWRVKELEAPYSTGGGGSGGYFETTWFG